VITVERATRPNGRIPHLDVTQAVDGKLAKRIGRSAVTIEMADLLVHAKMPD
jgi:hypothetical protein